MTRQDVQTTLIETAHTLEAKQSDLIKEPSMTIKLSDIEQYKRLGVTIERLLNLRHLINIGTL